MIRRFILTAVCVTALTVSAAAPAAAAGIPDLAPYRAGGPGVPVQDPELVVIWDAILDPRTRVAATAAVFTPLNAGNMLTRISRGSYACQHAAAREALYALRVIQAKKAFVQPYERAVVAMLKVASPSVRKFPTQPVAALVAGYFAPTSALTKAAQSTTARLQWRAVVVNRWSLIHSC